MEVDVPMCVDLTHSGLTWFGGNKCFLSRVLYDFNNKHSCRYSLETRLNLSYPQHSSIFMDYRYLIPPNRAPTIPELQTFKKVNPKVVQRIFIANELLKGETDEKKKFLLYQFKLCHLKTLLTTQSKKIDYSSRNVIPHLNQYYHTGILPVISLHRSRLFYDKGNEYHAGQHMTNLGMIGIVIDSFVNKVLRHACAKRERYEIWQEVFTAYPAMWLLMVDILLLYIFWGVYEPCDFHPPKFMVDLDVAAALGMMAHYMSKFSINEINQWLKDNENLCILCWCAYIYDQTDHTGIYHGILTKFFFHENYNHYLKHSLNAVRQHFSDFVKPIVAAHYQGDSLQTPSILSAWKRAFKEADQMADLWYLETKDPKYSPPCNIFRELLLMFKDYYNSHWNIKRKSSKKQYSEKKCFIPCVPEIHRWTTLFASWTVMSGSKIPLFHLLNFIGVPMNLINIINGLPFNLYTDFSWKLTAVKNTNFLIFPYMSYIPTVIYYLDMCWKFSEFRYIHLPHENEKNQIKSIRLKGLSPFNNPLECENLYVCGFCFTVKNAYSSANVKSLFTNLSLETLPELERKTERFLWHPKGQSGSTKGENVIINAAGEISCGTKYISNNIQHRNYICEMSCKKLNLVGKVVSTLDNLWWGTCESCGSRSSMVKINYSNEEITCDNCLAIEPKVQFYAYINGIGRPSHYFCNIMGCSDAAFKLARVINQYYQFELVSMCEFHFKFFKKTNFFMLTDLNLQFENYCKGNETQLRRKYSNINNNRLGKRFEKYNLDNSSVFS